MAGSVAPESDVKFSHCGWKMKISEKSLELNLGAELLNLLRGPWGMPKAYLRGLTQREERQQGVDFVAQLDPMTRIFAFQFKAPKGRHDGTPYRYTLVREQHDLLHALAQGFRTRSFTFFRSTRRTRSCKVTFPT
jgi:hypothetical protein